jgi:hypothetical protein
VTRTLDTPVFDSDNHLYESRDAFTRHLPKQYDGAIEYVDVRGRTKIMVKGKLSDYIPNPTFEVVARPGAQEEYFGSMPSTSGSTRSGRSTMRTGFSPPR